MIKGYRFDIYRISLFFSLFLFVIFSTPAQDTLLFHSSPASFTIKYNQTAGTRDKYSNEILDYLSEDAIKPLAKTAITIDFQLQISTVEKTPGVISLFAMIRDPVLKGDLFFRKFPIRDILSPDRVDLRLKVWKKGDSASMMESKVPHLLWTGKEKPVFISEIHGYGKNWDTLEVKDIFLYHDEEALTAFKERVHLINDYYAFSLVADSLLHMADAMDMRSSSRLLLNFLRLREICKMVDLFEKKNYVTMLDLNDHDPAGLNARMIRLFKFSKSAEMTFREFLPETGSIPPNQSVDSVVNYFLSGILRYIRWSLIMTTYNGRIYQEYLDNYFVKPAFGKDDPELHRQMFMKLYPRSNKDSLYRSFSENLKTAYEEKAAGLMQQDQYMEAVKLIDNEAQFCRVNPWLDAKRPDTALQLKAAMGIYSSYLGIAETCTENGKYDMAQKYLVKAMGWRRAQSGSASSDSLFNKVFHRIFDTWIAGCDSMAASGDFDKAINCYHQIGDRLDTSLVAGREEIDARIYLATSNMKHDSLGRKIYRSDLVNLLFNGESKIWTGQYHAAGIFADSVEQQFGANGFGDDSLAVKALRAYRNKIRQQVCWDLNESFEILMLRAQNEMEKKQYLKSAALLDSALVIAASAPLCNINITVTKEKLEKYSFAIRYQKNVLEIMKNITDNNYNEALKQNCMNEMLFIQHDLSRFGIEQYPLYDVIAAQNDPLFTGHAIVFYSNRDSLTEAFRYVKLLRSQGYPRRFAKDFLSILGKNIAAADFLKYPAGNPDTLIQEYVSDDIWFGRFRSSYLKEWDRKSDKVTRSQSHKVAKSRR